MPDPNTVILRENKIIFFCIPKVANTSIKRAILKGITGDDLSWYPENEKGVKVHHDDRLEYISNEEIFNGAYDNYLRLVFVRNPWDKFVSYFCEKVLESNSEAVFKDTVERVCTIPDKEAEIHIRSQWGQLTYRDNYLPGVRYKFEDISWGWKEIQFVCGPRGLKLPDLEKTNSHERKHYHNFYNTETMNLVKERYKKDIGIFGYEF